MAAADDFKGSLSRRTFQCFLCYLPRLQEDRWRTQLNGTIHAYNTARSPNGSALIQRLDMPFPVYAHQYMSVGPLPLPLPFLFRSSSLSYP